MHQLRKRETIRNLKEYKYQSLLLQAARGEDLEAMLPTIEEVFNHLEDKIMELKAEEKFQKK